MQQSDPALEGLMDERVRKGWSQAGIASAALILTLFSTACNTVTDPRTKYATNAHIEVTGSSPVPLLLVTSTNWGIEYDELNGEEWIVLIEADTAEIELPVERTVPLAPRYQILFRVINPDSQHDAKVRMRVRLDDTEVFDETRIMRDASMEYSFFYH